MTEIPKPAPPPERAVVRLDGLSERPLPEQVAVYEELHRELETRLRASET